MKTYRARWFGRDRWDIWDGNGILTPHHFIQTDQLEPVAYTIQRWEYGRRVEKYDTDDGEDLRLHMGRLSELMDAAPESFIDKDLDYLADWCDRHDLELLIRTT